MSARRDGPVVGGTPRVSLLPPEVAVRASARRNGRRTVIAVAAVVAFTATGVGAAGWYADASQRQLDDARAETSALLAEQAKYSEVSTLAELLATLQDARAYGTSTEVDWADYLALIEARMPAGTTLVEATMSAAAPWEAPPTPTGPLRGDVVATFHLRTTSATESDLTTWVRGLETLPGYADSSLDSRTLNNAGAPARTDGLTGVGGGAGYIAEVTVNIGADARANRFSAADPVAPDASLGAGDGTNIDANANANADASGE